jgi:hypothetical protein
MTTNNRKQGARSREQKSKIHDSRVLLLPAPRSRTLRGTTTEALP